MSKGIGSERFDHSGEVIAGLVQAELNKHAGQIIDKELTDEVRTHVATSIGIIGVYESTELLGVSKQRVDQLKHHQTSSKRLPKPIAQLASGPIWLREDMVRFQENRFD